MTDAIDPLVELSFRRSLVRTKSFLGIAEMKVAYPNQLARAIGVRVSRVREAMFGGSVGFSRQLAPIRMGLVELQPVGGRPAYVLTKKGAAVARVVRRMSKAKWRPAPTF